MNYFFFFGCRALLPSGLNEAAFSSAISCHPPACSPATKIASTIIVIGISRTSCVLRRSFCWRINSYAAVGTCTRQSFPVVSMRAKVKYFAITLQNFFHKNLCGRITLDFVLPGASGNALSVPARQSASDGYLRLYVSVTTARRSGA